MKYYFLNETHASKISHILLYFSAIQTNYNVLPGLKAQLNSVRWQRLGHYGIYTSFAMKGQVKI